MDKPLISVVSPVYGSPSTIAQLCALVGEHVGKITDEFELILVVGALMAQILPVTLVVWQMNDLQQRNLADSRALNRELRDSEARLAVSRRRVVDAADAERRRIERNLHDGAQQRLVALGVRLRLLEEQVSGDAELASTVGGLVGELEGAVDEVRELAHGIYPPLLRSQGLVAALRAVARRSASPVETDLATIERLDESSETAAERYLGSTMGRFARKFRGKDDAALVGDNWVGTVDDVVDDLVALKRQGIDRFVVMHTVTETFDEMLEQTTLFAEQVMPRVEQA